MHESMTAKLVHEFIDEIVHRNPKDRHNYVYCKTCGAKVKVNNSSYLLHVKQCKHTFKALRTVDPIPNDLLSEYSNLEEHIFKGKQLISKCWPYK